MIVGREKGQIQVDDDWQENPQKIVLAINRLVIAELEEEMENNIIAWARRGLLDGEPLMLPRGVEIITDLSGEQKKGPGQLLRPEFLEITQRNSNTDVR